MTLKLNLFVWGILLFTAHLSFGADPAPIATAPLAAQSPTTLAPQIFRVNQTEAPKTLDPHRLRSSSGGFLNQQLYRNFFIYDDKKSYVPELGEACVKKGLKWTCTLKKDLTWSSGLKITAQDFVQSYRRILTLPSPRADLLFNLNNAKEVFEQKKKPEYLGVKAIGTRIIEFTWAVDSPDNDLILMSPLFVPLPLGEFKKDVFSGPYQLSDQNNQRIRLSPNRQYFKKNSRPSVEFQLFEENLAVKAFEKKQIEFLRKVPTAQIPAFKDKPEFHWYSVLRLDSIGFGPELKDQLELRKSLTESLQFEELQGLFHSPGKVGCPGLSESMSDEVCYKGSAKIATPLTDVPALTFTYSTLGGDDHRRLAEWLQSQWQKNLKVSVALQPLENKIFQDLMEKKPTALFRKGLNLENPTCYNALQIFTSEHPDNFIQFKSKKYDGLVQKLKVASQKAKRKICTQALKVLMDSYVMIPTGRIHFAVLASPQWIDWRLNELNHLDLSELKAAP